MTLARDLTATEPTPFDQALAIEAYLRSFPYTLDLPAPPQDRDVVDYFLFDLQKGYCDYYATSRVVLARAAGVPARLVIGYLSGTYDVDLGAYLVTEAEAHSWVEVYFPGNGWVEFEPTGGRPAIERPGVLSTVTPGGLASGRLTRPGGNRERPGESLPGLIALSVALVALGAGGVAWLVLGRWRLGHGSTVGTATKVFRQIRRYGNRLGASVHRGDTPYELSEAVARRVKDLAQATGWTRALAPAAREVRWLADVYVQVSYGPRLPPDSTKTEIVRTWRRLRWRLWLARAGEGLHKRGLRRRGQHDTSRSWE
jgi:hypothetical protein